jgi:hypothetical protein
LAALTLSRLLLAATAILAAVPASAQQPAIAPPPDPPAVRDLAVPDDTPGIFTYRVDDRCRVTQTRKLQGPRQLAWREVERALGLFSEETVFRMVEGNRRQLVLRRVVLMGEMVESGELHCLLSPMGELVEAWIARTDSTAPRQRLPRREAAPVQRGSLGDLGTFSVIYQPAAIDPRR